MLNFKQFNEAYDSGAREHTISGTIHRTGEDKPTEFNLKVRAHGVQRINGLYTDQMKPKLTHHQQEALFRHFKAHAHDGPAAEAPEELLRGTSGKYKVKKADGQPEQEHHVVIKQHYAEKY